MPVARGAAGGAMKIFDEIRVQNLDRRQFQLTILASMTIVVLATGVAVLMYPAIFSQDILVSRQTLRYAFYGFCCLSVLLVGYLWDRQLTIRRLTKQVQTEQRRSNTFRSRACSDLLNTIPGVAGFREQLSALNRRSAGGKQAPVSVAVVRLYLSGMVSDKTDEQVVFGDAAQVIQRRLGRTDSIYVLSSGVYGVILTGMDRVSAQRFTASLELGLLDAAGVDSRFTADVQLLKTPEDGKSLQEIDHLVTALLPVVAVSPQGQKASGPQMPAMTFGYGPMK
jgi:hypothetical protein